MSTTTVYDCESITYDSATVDGETSEWYDVVLDGGSTIRFPQGKVCEMSGGCVCETARDAITEVTGTPITSIKQELFYEGTSKYVVYTTDSE